MSQPTKPTEADSYPDGLPEDLYIDIESTIHQHCGHDGQSDEANDWVTDLMAALTPLIVRELVGGRPAPTREQIAATIERRIKVWFALHPERLTDAANDAAGAVVALLSRSAAEPPEDDEHAAALDIIRLLLAIGDEGQHYYELGDDGPTGSGSWVRVDAVTKAWEVWRDVTPAERAVLDGVAAEPKEHGDG